MNRNLCILFLFMLMSSGQIFGQVLRPASIIEGKLEGVSRNVRDIPAADPNEPTQRRREFGEDDPANRVVKFNVYNPNAKKADGALQNFVMKAKGGNGFPIAAPVRTFDGNTAADNAAVSASFAGLTPPDMGLAAGPNHVVQMINCVYSVYSKTGTRLAGPAKFSAIAPTADNSGDPIVLYDQIADRWIMMQFSNLNSGTDKLIFAVSKTPDPTGAYYVYSFVTATNMPDYPHVGIWNNMYTITAHEFKTNAWYGQAFYAIDRNKMIAGAATTTLIRFVSPSDGGFLPVSAEGTRPPEAGSPATYWGYVSDETGGVADGLVYRSLYADFTNPTNSYITDTAMLVSSSFDGSLPTTTGGASFRNAVSQSGTTVAVDALADRMMGRIIYRKFDTYEAIVCNHTCNISGAAPTAANKYQAAIRWYELRRSSPSSPWSIYQQGTYNPNPINGNTGIDLWNGCAGFDQKGNIGLGYSRSSSTLFPSIYYATRLTTDPLGQLGAEQVLYAGTGSQTNTGYRWGDYSQICADASGDTLWYSNEYYSATSSTTFKTRIGAFVIQPNATPAVHFKMGGSVVSQTGAVLPSPTACQRYTDYPIDITIDQAPSQAATVTFSTSGTATLGADYDLIYTPPLQLSAGNLTKQVIVRVYDDGQTEPDEYAYISITVNPNGGDAIKATYNTIYQLTISAHSGADPNSYITKSYGTAATVFSDNFDSYTAGTLGTWTQQQLYLTPGAVFNNNFVVGTNGGAGMTNKSLYISTDGSAYNYNITPVSSTAAYNVTRIRVVSPTIDLTGKGQASLSFTWKCTGEKAASGSVYDYGTVWYSMDGGTTWATDGTWFANTAATAAATKTVTLPPSFENVSNVKLAFQWENDDNGGAEPPLAIDNLVLTAKPISYSNPQIQSATDAATAISYNFNSGQTVNFVDTTTKRIEATIVNNSSFAFGCTKVIVDRAGTSGVAFNANNVAYALASKTFKATPTNTTASASYSVSLYYTEAEIAGWEAYTGKSRSTLKMIKVDATNGIGEVTPATQASYTYDIAAASLTAFGTGGWMVTASFSDGMATNVGFGIGDPTTTPLPVTLISFKGEHIKGQGNKLVWVVSNQLNVKQYQLQHSADGVTFKTVALVSPKANSASELSYDNLHKTYVNGNNFYRLRTVDMDGTERYSSVININVNEKGTSVVIYPNPVSDNLIVNYRGESAQVNIEIVDMDGKVSYASKTAITNPITIPVSKLAAGNYVLRITDAAGSISSKFVKK